MIHTMPNLTCAYKILEFVLTFNPRSSSFSDRLISLVSIFMRSHSWKATRTYGDLSSGGTLAMISSMLNSSGSFSTISSKIPLICTNDK